MPQNIDSVKNAYLNSISLNLEKIQTSKENRIKIEKVIEERKLSDEEYRKLSEALASAADSLLTAKHDVSLTYNEAINRIIILVKNKETGELVTEIPCKELQDLALSIRELIGKLYDQKV